VVRSARPTDSRAERLIPIVSARSLDGVDPSEVERAPRYRQSLDRRGPEFSLGQKSRLIIQHECDQPVRTPLPSLGRFVTRALRSRLDPSHARRNHFPPPTSINRSRNRYCATHIFEAVKTASFKVSLVSIGVLAIVMGSLSASAARANSNFQFIPLGDATLQFRPIAWVKVAVRYPNIGSSTSVPKAAPSTVSSGEVLGASVSPADPVTHSELVAAIAEVEETVSTRAPASPSFSGPAASTPVSFATFSSSQNIGQLSGITITNATVHGVSGLTAADIPRDIVASNYLPLSGGALAGNLVVSGSFNAGSVSFSGASTTNATSTNLAVTSVASSLLKTNALGQVAAAIAGIDYALPGSGGSGFPFAVTSYGVSTSTLVGFVSGLFAFASSTIGDGTPTGGLTISGAATTTGRAYFAGNVGIGTSTPSTALSLSGGAISLANGGSFATIQYPDANNGGNFSTGELLINNNAASGQNTLALRNANATGISALTLRGDDNFEHLSLGHVNSAGGFTGPGSDFLEVSNFPDTTLPPPDFFLARTGVINGSMRTSFKSLTIESATGRWFWPTIDSSTSTAAFVLDPVRDYATVPNTLLVGRENSTSTPVANIDVYGNAAIGSYSSIANRASDCQSFVLCLEQSTSNQLRLINANVVKVDFLINGSGSTRRLDLTDTDNGSIVPLSIALNGSGMVTIGSLVDNGSASFNDKVAIGTSTPYSRLAVWGPDSNATTSAFSVVNSASTTAFAVYDNGNATYAGSIFQSSDARLKTNIQPLDASSSLSAIESLTPVSYDRLDQPGQGSNLGFIAQAVAGVFPELVSTTSATALTPDGTLTLNYVGLIAPLVAAMQQIAADVSSLAAEVSVLETAISGFADSFTTKQLCVDKVDGTPVCITGDQLAAVVSASPSVPVSAPSPIVISGTSTPPSITIEGDNPAIVQIGDTYTDPGAIVIDSLGHDLSYRDFVNGVLSGDIVIDTSQVATDTIDYVATDAWGNIATGTRTVVIVASASSTP